MKKLEPSTGFALIPSRVEFLVTTSHLKPISIEGVARSEIKDGECEYLAIYKVCGTLGRVSISEEHYYALKMLFNFLAESHSDLIDEYINGAIHHG